MEPEGPGRARGKSNDSSFLEGENFSELKDQQNDS